MNSSNKISTFIGIVLLTAIVGFTVYVNFFVEEPTKNSISKSESLKTEVTKNYIDTYTEQDIANLGKLKNVHTDYISEKSNKEETEIKLYEDVKVRNSKVEQKKTTYYGKLKFNHAIRFEQDRFTKLKSFYVSSFVRDGDYDRIRQIGDLFINYQINSVITQEKYGDFTCIYLKNGARIFLIKKGTEVKDKYYQMLIEASESINDSTKIAYPHIVREVNQ